ncbi:MAG: DUF2225 domain-containing protein [Myxococcales bacterium]|nr:DUF2225 domain-containing protein [Myxococcales bacterium]
MSLAALLLMTTSQATAAPPSTPTTTARAKIYRCPLCGTQAQAIGHDGKPSPRRYSDLEVPTRAYTNLVVACSKCGHAAWSQDFESPVSGAAQRYARRYLAKTAKRAAQDPVFAYQHHMNLLHVRRASLQEQIGAALFYSYVLKRRRPYGGMDAKLETRIQKARQRALALLKLAHQNDPPSDKRTRLEWQYLIGELMRLTGKPKAALPYLNQVCWAKKDAGYTVGRLSCQMALRAKGGETIEDYRDGVTDVQQIAKAKQRAAKLAAQTAKEARERKKRQALARAKAQAAAKRDRDKRGVQKPPSSSSSESKDPYAPTLPPVAK